MAISAMETARPIGFRFDRYRVAGVVGVLLSVFLFWQVSSNVPASKVTTLRITWPGAKPVDPPLLDIPLPTVATVGVICALLAMAGIYLFITARKGWFAPYVGSLIFATEFIILLWAGAGSRVDMVDMLARMVRLATPIAL